jgi:hypothetical protein
VKGTGACGAAGLRARAAGFATGAAGDATAGFAVAAGFAETAGFAAAGVLAAVGVLGVVLGSVGRVVLEGIARILPRLRATSPSLHARSGSDPVDAERTIPAARRTDGRHAMGAWNFIFDNELFQRMDIEDLRRQAEHSRWAARRASRRTNDRLEDVEKDLAEVVLLCRALVSMLRERGVFDENALQAALRAVDAEDGVIDGRVTPESERPKPPGPPIQAPVPTRRRGRDD